MDKVFSQLLKYLSTTATKHEALYEVNGRYAMRYCVDPRHDSLCKALIYALEKSVKLAAYIPLEPDMEAKIGAVLMLVYHLSLVHKADRAITSKPVFDLTDRMLSVLATMFDADSCRTKKKDQSLWKYAEFTVKSIGLNIEGVQFRAAILKILELLSELYMKDCVYLTEIEESHLGPDHTSSRPMVFPDSFTAVFRCITALIVKTVT